MLDYAQRRSAEEELANVEFLHADAQVNPFEPCSFDVAISAFGAMFFADPLEAFSNIRRSLCPGGHIAFLSWQRFEHTTNGSRCCSTHSPPVVTCRHRQRVRPDPSDSPTRKR